MRQTYNYGLRSPIQVEIAYRVAHWAIYPQPSEEAFVVGKTIDDEWSGAICLITDRSPGRAPHEGCNRGGYASNGAHTAGKFFNVHAGISRCNRHERPSPLLLFASRLP